MLEHLTPPSLAVGGWRRLLPLAPRVPVNLGSRYRKLRTLICHLYTEHTPSWGDPWPQTPTSKRAEAEARVGARITPEEIEKERARIGYTVGNTYQWNVEASIDSIRHFANGCGDDNPMWCDEAYAGATRWGGVVASPLFYMTMGDDRSPKAPPELKEKARARSRACTSSTRAPRSSGAATSGPATGSTSSASSPTST